MNKPHCLCTGRAGVRCDETHCDLATGPGAPGDPDQCRICWKRLGRPGRAGGLGDAVGRALSLFGITDQRVSRLLARPCGCHGRRQKLNALGAAVARLAGMAD